MLYSTYDDKISFKFIVWKLLKYPDLSPRTKNRSENLKSISMIFRFTTGSQSVLEIETSQGIDPYTSIFDHKHVFRTDKKWF